MLFDDPQFRLLGPARPMQDFLYAFYRGILHDVDRGILDQVLEFENASAIPFLRVQKIGRMQLRIWIQEYHKRKLYWDRISRVRQAIATCRRGRIRSFELDHIDGFIRQYGFARFSEVFRIELEEYQSWNPLRGEE